MAQSEFDLTATGKPILEIELPGFSEKKVLRMCTENEMNVRRFASRVNDKRKVRGLLLLPKLPGYIQKLKKKYPSFPITWADHIDFAHTSIRETPLYSNQPFLFRVQLKHDPREGDDVIKLTMRIEITRKEDNEVVLGGVFKIDEYKY